MSKTTFRPFWSFDVVKTEEWLSEMHASGYALQKVNFALRLFVFDKTQAEQMFYRIVFDKQGSGAQDVFLKDCAYDQVCFSKKFSVLRTEQTELAMSPSYDGFLKRNKMIGMVSGNLLLFLSVLFLPVLLIGSIMSFGASVEFTYDTTDVVAFFVQLILLIPSLLIFQKLRKTNRELEKLCGDTLDLSYTVPKETLLRQSEIARLKAEGQLIIRTKLAWQYAPDKVEIWLEKMAEDGYRLIQLSRPGKSFYFLKAEPHKEKFHIDYQNKTDPAYFNLNKESGWKLFFTSLSRFQNLSVWGQEYTDEPPMFYSDRESRIKHARRFALTYSICFYPMCILFMFIVVRNILFLVNFGPSSSIFLTMLLYMLLVFEFGFFATRTLLYYFRVKKAARE